MKYVKKYKTFIFFLVIIGLLALLFARATSTSQVEEISLFRFYEEAGAGKIEVLIYDETKSAGFGKYVQDYKEGGRFKVGLPSNDPELNEIIKGNENFRFIKSSDSPWWSALVNILPFLLLVGVFVFFFWSSAKQSGLNLGKSKAKMFAPHTIKTRFDDVAGVNEAKEELKEIIDFLKNPNKFNRLGAKIPKGVLLAGPPGTGKTLLAKAVAGEAGVPFFSTSGSEFVEMFVGRGAARVRDLFAEAKRNAPCIIFVDEIDAIGRHRGAGIGSGHDEREQTLNQIFVEMDGFDPNLGIIILAATNRPDILDPAFIRPGRFDRKVVLNKPDLNGREAILKVHVKGKPLASDVELNILARGTAGTSGADLANVVNEAAILAGRQGKPLISASDFQKAFDKVLMGKEIKTIVSEEEKEIIAYHEAGHTLLAKLLKPSDPIYKVSIISRAVGAGIALGQTVPLPDFDRHLYDKEYLANKITICHGGMAAEALIGKRTSGSENDIKAATEIAHKMVCELGMSKLGPRAFGSREGEVFLGREITVRKEISEKTLQKVDEEVERILEICQKEADVILTKNRSKLEALVKALLERETLGGKEIDEIIEKSGK